MSFWSWYTNSGSETKKSATTPSTAHKDTPTRDANETVPPNHTGLSKEEAKNKLLEPKRAPLCCPTFFPNLDFVQHTWSYAPKQRHRLNDFMQWVKEGQRADSELVEGWEYVISYADMDKADFCFSVATSRGTKPHVEYFLPLTNNNGMSSRFFKAGDCTDETGVGVRFDPEPFLLTGNSIRLTCPTCTTNFIITLLRKRDRTTDIQPVDIKDSTQRKKVEELKENYTSWRYKDLYKMLLNKRGNFEAAKKEIKSLEDKKNMEDARKPGWDVVYGSDVELGDAELKAAKMIGSSQM